METINVYIEKMNKSLINNDFDEFMIILEKLIMEEFSMAHIAEKTIIRRESLYKVFKGNPGFMTLMLILKSMGLRFSTVSLHKVECKKKNINSRNTNMKQSLKKDLLS